MYEKFSFLRAHATSVCARKNVNLQDNSRPTQIMASVFAHQKRQYRRVFRPAQTLQQRGPSDRNLLSILNENVAR